MEIVGNFNTEADEAMELCKTVQAEEYVIHVVVGSTNFYTHLRFFLLGSSWFPRPLGVCLWSALHMFLALYEALMLLVLVPIVFVLAVVGDTIIVVQLTYMVLLFPFAILAACMGISIAVALSWLWLMITCKCCTMPGRAPGQGLGQYIFTAGGDLRQGDPQPAPPQPAPPVEGRAAPIHESPCAALVAHCRDPITRRFVNHVIQVTFPYRRAQLVDLCREVLPLYDTIVI